MTDEHDSRQAELDELYLELAAAHAELARLRGADQASASGQPQWPAASSGLFGLLRLSGVEFFEWRLGSPFRCSSGFRMLAGLADDEPRGEGPEAWLVHVHPDDRARLQRRLDAAGSHQMPPVEYRVVGCDGRTRWLRTASRLERDPGGRIVAIAAVTLEVTGEHEARALLAERAAFLEAVPDCILKVTRDGSIPYVNSVAEGFFRQSLGAPPANLEQLPDVQDKLEEMRAHFRAVMDRGEAARFPFVAESHPQRPVFDVVVTPLRDEEGRIEGAVLAARDVSRLYHAEREARATLRRFETLVETARASILLVDDEGRITLVNRAFCEAAGYAPAQVIGSLMRDYCFAEDAEQRRLQVRELLAKGAVSFNWRLKRADGGASHFRVDASTTESPHRARREFLFVATDISDELARAAEREDLQRQVYHAQKAESLGLMASGIAHDLNNMLMAAIGQLSLAQQYARPDTALAGHLATVESVLGRMEGLTQRMLAYAGKGAERVEDFDFARLLDASEPLLRASAGLHTRLHLEIDSRPLPVSGDENQLEQVVLNLVQNAVDAMGERGGQVRVRAATLPASSLPSDQLLWPLRPAEAYVELTVSDDGPGIPDESIARVFEPFYTTKTTGRGLGLSVVQGIVRAHGGSIFLRSRGGCGTEFRIFLPLVAQAPQLSGSIAPLATEQSADDGPAPRILVIDDDEDVLAITGMMLEQGGFVASVHLDGDEAIAVLARDPGAFDAAVIDLTMPDKDGITVARELRALAADLPVLFVSGYSKELTHDIVRPDERTAFLRKPFRAEGLKEALRALLR
jgi:PAS domain S-box-containing protein